MTKKLSGKVALVTGGSRGIGAASARALAGEGASVAISYVASPDKAEAVVAELKAKGVQARAYKADQASSTEVERLVNEVAKDFGRLDILVNNAGGYEEPVFPDAPVAHWTSALDLNLRSAMLAIHHAVGAMGARSGAIINVASSAGLGLAPHPGPEYAAAKSALMRLTACLAPLVERGIRVNCVCPHTVGTEAVRRTIAELTAAGQELPAPLRDPLLEPEQVADAVIELLRDERLAGRVIVCRGGEPRRLLSTGTEVDAPPPQASGDGDADGYRGGQRDPQGLGSCGRDLLG